MIRGIKVLFLSIILISSGCLGTVNDTFYGDSVVVTNQNEISCENWQEGRYWNLNGERIFTDDSCKGQGDVSVNPQLEAWDLEEGDIIEYLLEDEINCRVTISEQDLDLLEADCHFPPPEDQSVDEQIYQSDLDQDGVNYSEDLCPDTGLGETVDSNGCSWNQLDGDLDGVLNEIDLCEYSLSRAIVDELGCNVNTLAVFGSYFRGGALENGDQPSAVRELGSGIIDIAVGIDGYAALRSDGSVFVWPSQQASFDPHEGFSNVQDDLVSSVVSIHTDGQNYVAMKSDGSVVSWGPNQNFFYSDIEPSIGPGAIPSLVGIIDNSLSFLRSDGSVIKWGNHPSLTTEKNVDINHNLSRGIESMMYGSDGYIAIKSDDSVYFVHYSEGERPDLTFSPFPANVKGSSIEKFLTTSESAAVLQKDGTLHVFGYTEMFVNTSSESLVISNIEDLVSNNQNILARDFSGKMYIWSEHESLTQRKVFQNEFIEQIQIRPSGFSAKNISGHWTHWGRESHFCIDENLNDTLHYTNLSELIFLGSGCLAQKSSGEIVILAERNFSNDIYASMQWHNSTLPTNQTIDAVHCTKTMAACLFLGTDGVMYAWGNAVALTGFESFATDLRVRDVYYNDFSFAVVFH